MERSLTFPQDHCAGEVLDRLLDDVREDEHHRFGLLFREPFILEPLHEFEGVEVVVPEQEGGGGEGLLGEDSEGGG